MLVLPFGRRNAYVAICLYKEFLNSPGALGRVEGHGAIQGGDPAATHPSSRAPGCVQRGRIEGCGEEGGMEGRCAIRGEALSRCILAHELQVV